MDAHIVALLRGTEGFGGAIILGALVYCRISDFHVLLDDAGYMLMGGQKNFETSIADFTNAKTLGLLLADYW